MPPRLSRFHPQPCRPIPAACPSRPCTRDNQATRARLALAAAGVRSLAPAGRHVRWHWPACWPRPPHLRSRLSPIHEVAPDTAVLTVALQGLRPAATAARVLRCLPAARLGASTRILQQRRRPIRSTRDRIASAVANTTRRNVERGVWDVASLQTGTVLCRLVDGSCCDRKSGAARRRARDL